MPSSSCAAIDSAATVSAGAVSRPAGSRISRVGLPLVGGYLVLNATGRPLEFHCTAPVKANRAQQILFGPTLESFLYGEQIGQTLVAKSGLAPLAIYTDVEPALKRV